MVSGSGGNCKIVHSSYIGTNSLKTVTLSMRPYYVIIYDGNRTNSSYIGWNYINKEVTIKSNGFTVSANSDFNNAGNSYTFIAFGV